MAPQPTLAADFFRVRVVEHSRNSTRDLGAQSELDLMVLQPGERCRTGIGEAAWWRAWVEGSSDYMRAAERPRADEHEIRSELLFCLVGGHGITFELAESAWERLVELRCLTDDWDFGELEGLLEREFSRPQFRPVRRDGSLRRYRYPRLKARLLVAALRWIESKGSLTVALNNVGSEAGRRDLLCQCPGVGPKTASWILRNGGYAVELAILDVHILRAMEREGRRPPGRLPAAYERIEEAFVRWCRDLGVPPAAFDLFLWEWQRDALGQNLRHGRSATQGGSALSARARRLDAAGARSTAAS